MELRGTDLGCVRGGRRVFAGVNFAVAAGTPLLLTGANGAGKSSLLRLIAGLIHPDHGTVAIEGGDDELTVGEQTHYLGHLDPLKGALTVMENLAFWVRFLNAEAGPGRAGSGGAQPRHRRPRGARRRARPATSRPASGAGCRLPAWSRSRGRSGSSTSRPPRSMPRPRSGSTA